MKLKIYLILQLKICISHCVLVNIINEINVKKIIKTLKGNMAKFFNNFRQGKAFLTRLKKSTNYERKDI